MNTNTTENIIYNMLTESTGANMMDSGGDTGRHWQHNKKKTLEDFNSEDCINIGNKNADNVYDAEITKSLFHHLNESVTYDHEKTELLKTYLEDINAYGSNSDAVSQFMEEELIYSINSINKDARASHFNSYNEDCVLSQTIMGIYLGDIYDCEYIALSIHNGADVRGGYTDYKIFKIDQDIFYNWTPDSYEYELENQLETV